MSPDRALNVFHMISQATDFTYPALIIMNPHPQKKHSSSNINNNNSHYFRHCAGNQDDEEKREPRRADKKKDADASYLYCCSSTLP